MTTCRPVRLDCWVRLEERLLARWSRRKADEALRAIRKWAGWRWPSERECLDAVRISQRVAARRRREAAAELPAMRTLPPVTPADQLPLLLERRRFGIATDIVRSEDRTLSPFHAWAILPTVSLPMLQVVSRMIGGRLLVPFDELASQAQQRDEDQDVRLIQLEDERLASARPEFRRGPCVTVLFS
jgi:hypothetical protein